MKTSTTAASEILINKNNHFGRISAILLICAICDSIREFSFIRAIRDFSNTIIRK